MDLCVYLVIQPYFLRDLLISIFLYHELVNLLIQPVFKLSLCRVLAFQHQTSLRKILVLAKEPFVGLLGADPGSEELLAKQIPQLPALLEIAS